MAITTVVMFVMVSQVKMPKRLDVTRAANQWATRVPQLGRQNYGVSNSP